MMVRDALITKIIVQRTMMVRVVHDHQIFCKDVPWNVCSYALCDPQYPCGDPQQNEKNQKNNLTGGSKARISPPRRLGEREIRSDGK